MQIKGIPASAGVAWGHALQLPPSALLHDSRTLTLLSVPTELNRFDMAVNLASEALATIRTSLLEEGRKEEADIIEVQIVLLSDRELVGKARDIIAQLRYTSQAALEETMKEVLDTMRQHDPVHFKERAMDIEDVVHRIIRVLRGEKGILERMVTTDRQVLICDNLSPSEAVLLNPQTIAGIALIHGSATSHFAIIARSIGIPSVTGLGQSLQDIRDGQLLLLNGTSGTITIDPTKQELEECGQHQAEFACETHRESVRRMTTQRSGSAGPLLLSNISSVAEASTAHRFGADGIGLFRTEFLYMGRADFPSEEEQFAAYRSIVSAFDAGTPIVIRTMDVGGDKPLASLRQEKEDNPFLGIRGIRLSLMRQDLLRTQLRAILRASAYGNIKLLFPMIATLSEWKLAASIVEETKTELFQSGIGFNPAMETGIMIEVPSAALIADRLAQEADFFSIGTNDLIQYTMAASRNSPSLGELHDPLQPAVLRLIQRVIRCAHDHNKQVSLCGEMASEMTAVPLLLGMGLDAFSVSNEALSSVGWQLSLQSKQWDKEHLRQAAEAVMDLDHASDVRRYVELHFPEIHHAVQQEKLGHHS